MFTIDAYSQYIKKFVMNFVEWYNKNVGQTTEQSKNSLADFEKIEILWAEM